MGLLVRLEENFMDIYEVKRFVNRDSGTGMASPQFKHPVSKTDQTFVIPIQRTVDGFISTGRNVLSLRAPQTDYDFVDGKDTGHDNLGSFTHSLYEPDLADVSTEIVNNSTKIKDSVSRAEEKIAFEKLRKSELI